MNYNVSHSKNDCHIALYAPSFWYKHRGRRQSGWIDNECIAADFRKYVEAYNSMLIRDAEDFLEDFYKDMKEAKSELDIFAADKEIYKMAVNASEKSDESTLSHNAGYQLAKANKRLIDMHASVKNALERLENRLSYCESYHLPKLKSFIDGVRVHEPELADELGGIINNFFLRAQTVYDEVYNKIKSHGTRLELRRQTDDFKRIYEFGKRQGTDPGNQNQTNSNIEENPGADNADTAN